MGQFHSSRNSIHATSDNNGTPRESPSTSGSFDSDHPEHAVGTTTESESNQLHHTIIQIDNDNDTPHESPITSGSFDSNSPDHVASATPELVSNQLEHSNTQINNHNDAINENSSNNSTLSETPNVTEPQTISTSPVSNHTQHLQDANNSVTDSLFTSLRDRLRRSQSRSDSNDEVSSHGDVNGDSTLNNGNNNNDIRLRNRVVRPATRNSAQRSNPINQPPRTSRKRTLSERMSSSDSNSGSCSNSLIHASSDNNNTSHESLSTSGSFDSTHLDHTVSTTTESEFDQLDHNNIQFDNHSSTLNANGNADSTLPETTNATEPDAASTSPVSNRTQHLQGTDDSDDDSQFTRLRERLRQSQAIYQNSSNNNNSNVNGDSTLNNGNNNNDIRLRNRVVRPATRNSAQRSNPINQQPRANRRHTDSAQNSDNNSEISNRNPIHTVNNNTVVQSEIQSQTQQQQQQQEQQSQDRIGAGVEPEEETGSPFAHMVSQMVQEVAGQAIRSIIGPGNAYDSGTRHEAQLGVSPQLYRQLEPDQASNIFMRLIRIPIRIRNFNDQIDPPAEETLETRIPMFLYALRTNHDGSLIHHPTEEDLAMQRQEENARVNSLGDQRARPNRYRRRGSVGQNVDTGSNDDDDNINTRSSRFGTMNRTDIRMGIRDGGDRRRRERSASPEVQPRRSERIRNQRRRTQTEVISEDNSNANSNNTSNASTSNADTNNENEGNDARADGTLWRVYIISGNRGERWFNNDGTVGSLLGMLNAIDGVSNVGGPNATQEAIDQQLPLVQYNEDIRNTALGQSDVCPMCFEGYGPLEDVRMLNCRHVFHIACVDQWITQHTNRCPLCRRTAVSSISSA